MNCLIHWGRYSPTSWSVFKLVLYELKMGLKLIHNRGNWSIIIISLLRLRWKYILSLKLLWIEANILRLSVNFYRRICKSCEVILTRIVECLGFNILTRIVDCLGFNYSWIWLFLKLHFKIVLFYIKIMNIQIKNLFKFYFFNSWKKWNISNNFF